MHNTDVGEYLKEHGEALIAPMGQSMLPLLKEDRCQVLLKYPTESLKKYDVVLYRSKNGRLILHRIIRVLPSEYLICGDNTYTCEKGIKEKQILGVMAGFYRKNTYVSCDNAGYQSFVRIWWTLYPLRKLIVCILRKLVRRKGND